MYSVGNSIVHRFWGKGTISHVFFTRVPRESRRMEGITFKLLDKKKRIAFNKSRERIPGLTGDIIHRCYEDNLNLISNLDV